MNPESLTIIIMTFVCFAYFLNAFKCVQALYESLCIMFLLEESDTIVAYEERGKQKTASAASSYQQGIDAFTSSLGRVQQIELLQGKLVSLIYDIMSKC